MARLLGFAAQYPECTVTVVYVPPADQDEKQTEDMTVIENCLDSWKFDFSMNYGSDYYIRIADTEGNKYIGRGVNEVVSLTTLGDQGKRLVGEFFRAGKDEERTGGCFIRRPGKRRVRGSASADTSYGENDADL